MQINQRQLPIKLHYFCFMAAMGPILPFISVYGKQLGVSTVVMGAITAILPILYLISKPIFGFLVDYFRAHRKTIFLTILIAGPLAFVLLYFLPISSKKLNINFNITFFSHPSIFCNQLKFCNVLNVGENQSAINYQAEINCQWIYNNTVENDSSINVTFKDIDQNGFIIPSCLIHNTQLKDEVAVHKNNSICTINEVSKYNNVSCYVENMKIHEDVFYLYTSYKFWIFVLLMSIGNISFNITNSLTDAICFDILGEGGEMGYGHQRVWGTIGFGIAALIAGYAIDIFSHGEIVKSYMPAFILIIIFTCLDVMCCQKLDLPKISRSKTIAKDVIELIKKRAISIFLIFATIAGIIDSFIIYFLFWYLEDLAVRTNYSEQIKSIEGLTVAAQTLGGEVIVFLFSGKILKKFGYGYTLSFCFICYALRLALISLAPNPWWVVLIELFMQGPTYALCYTIIVSMASVIAPPGTSATVQGIAAGMDDGFGFAIGSFFSGILYKKFGGLITIRIFSSLALITGITYLLLYITILKDEYPETKVNEKRTNDNVVWKSPEDALRECEIMDKNDA